MSASSVARAPPYWLHQLLVSSTYPSQKDETLKGSMLATVKSERQLPVKTFGCLDRWDRGSTRRSAMLFWRRVQPPCTHCHTLSFLVDISNRDKFTHRRTDSQQYMRPWYLFRSDRVYFKKNLANHWYRHSRRRRRPCGPRRLENVHS